jgi:small subunit ribosomal protein S18
MAKKARVKNKDNARRSKKKVSILTHERVEYVDYKDVNLLRRFMSDRAKIRARRVTGNDSEQQKEVARAIKNAREMALLPYTNRVTQTRSSGGGRGGGGAGVPEGPPPVPSAPPPTRQRDDGDSDEPLEPADTGETATDDAAEAAPAEPAPASADTEVES